MSELTQKSTQLERYKDIVLQRTKEYYKKNKEKRSEYQKNRYKNLSQEEKKKLVKKRKEWFNKQSEEKKIRMRRKARERSKNRYHNHMVLVK